MVKDRDLGYMLFYAQKERARIVDILSNRFNLLGASQKMLFYIGIHPGLTGKEFSEKFHVSKAAVTLSIKSLFEKELITVDESAKINGKYKPLILTEKGEEIAKEIEILFTDIDTAIFGNITDEEKEIVYSVFRKISKNIMDYEEKSNIAKGEIF